MPSDPKKFRRFTVLLTAGEHADLVRTAREKEISRGELARRAVKRAVNEHRQQQMLERARQFDGRIRTHRRA